MININMSVGVKLHYITIKEIVFAKYFGTTCHISQSGFPGPIGNKYVNSSL